MKKYLLLSLILSGCVTGEGSFTGKLVDVTWSGLIFKSCEIRQQAGVVLDEASSTDKAMCDLLKTKVGQDVAIKYETQIFAFFTETPHIITEAK